MLTFAYPALLGGLALVGVPVLIHLINMFRHRRVEWAAMEFLLVSQKRNRTRVILKQLLLLLLRMAAVAAVVLMLARPQVHGRFSGFFGGRTTHHVVLLDDSFSMSDRWGDTSAFTEAKAIVRRIGTDAGRRPEPQTFTLLRFSRAAPAGRGARPDFLEETVDSRFVDRLVETLEPLEPSETAAGPKAALDAIGQLLEATGNEQRTIYLVTDFRAREWGEPTDLRNHLAEIEAAGARLHLINCVDAARANLAIAKLSADERPRAAGVPLFMEVTVANFGPAPVSDVPVLLEADGHARPAIKIPRIPPGESAGGRFAVHFPTAGEHRLVARLETDSVQTDNFRYGVFDFPAELPVLLIDGAPEARDATYLSAALSPGAPVITGINPRIEKPRYLSLNPLEGFRAIYLLNIERLDRSAIEALERYLASGGGVGVFLGPRCDATFFNEALYRNGEGFFPLPLVGPEVLMVDRLRKAPDLEVSEHPIFKILAGARNSFVSTVTIDRYFSVPDPWPAEVAPTTRVIAGLRNGAPLAVERAFGDGRVAAFLTTAAPEWNNWARGNPSFPVAMLELQAFLSARSQKPASRSVGEPLRLEFDAAEYETQVRFSTPAAEGSQPTTTDAVPAVEPLFQATLSETDQSGFYEAALSRKNGTEEIRHFAYNVDAAEGDLATVTASELAARLGSLRYKCDSAEKFLRGADPWSGTTEGRSMFLFLLCLLTLLLIGEQALGYSAGYHPPGANRAQVAGGVR
jgi:hypothetical protein